MADPKGFLTTPRETPIRRLVDLRLLDWREVYEPFPPSRLPFGAAGRERLVHLVPVPQPQVDGTPGRGLPRRGQEALRVSHDRPLTREPRP